MTIFENTKIAKIGEKRLLFFHCNDSKRIFGTEIDENEIQNCKSLEQNT